MDTQTEQIIQRALATLLNGRTSFVIAHRLSTITQADKIVVIQDGKIIEQGTHTELLANQGMYYELYRTGLERVGATRLSLDRCYQLHRIFA